MLVWTEVQYSPE